MADCAEHWSKQKLAKFCALAHVCALATAPGIARISILELGASVACVCVGGLTAPEMPGVAPAVIVGQSPTLNGVDLSGSVSEPKLATNSVLSVNLPAIVEPDLT